MRTSAEFDPNAPEVEPVHRWASYSDTRNRDKGFKTHSDFAKMRSAIHNCRVIRCFERVGGQWVEIYAHSYNKGGTTLVGADSELCFFCGENKGYWSWSSEEPFTERRVCFMSKCKRMNGVYRVPDQPLTPHSTAATL